MGILCKATTVVWEGRSCHQQLEGVYLNLLDLVRRKSTTHKVGQCSPSQPPTTLGRAHPRAFCTSSFSLHHPLSCHPPQSPATPLSAAEPAPRSLTASLPRAGTMSRGSGQRDVTAPVPEGLTQSPPTITKRPSLM